MKALNLSFIILFLVVSACDDDDGTQTNIPLLTGYEVESANWTLEAEYEYNSFNKLTSLSWRRETPSVTVGSDKYTYNDQGQVVEMIRTITGLTDERISYRFDETGVFASDHFSNDTRFMYILYSYDEKGKLVRMEESYRLPQGGGHERGDETEFSYYEDGNLHQVKNYFFDQENAELILMATRTYSGYIVSPNPVDPLDILPNLALQKNLPSKLTVETQAESKVYDYTYDLRKDRYPSKRVTTTEDGTTETMTYIYQ